MQTLPAGSFLHLENDSAVENLKFTARLLAEHSEKVIKENLDATTLENLVNNLWQKAEYVTRETERRRLQQIFVENFTEQFRQLKPEPAAVTPIENLVSELLASQKAFTSQTGAAGISAAQESQPVTEQIVPVETKDDEFLGIVKTSELFGETVVAAPTETPETTVTAEAVESAVIPAQIEIASETVKTEDKNIPSETPAVTTDQIVPTPPAEKTADLHLSADVSPVTAQKASPIVNQSKSSPVANTPDKEPFEFGKCTIDLNLRLLPGFGNSQKRKAIISTKAHDLPPEIELLEIGESENLEQIAELVKDKLARFRNTLPVKYIEQLRAAKTKTSKPAPPPTTTPAVAAATDQDPTTAENKSGEQNSGSAAQVNVPNSLPATVAATNDAQPSLF